MTSVPLSQFQYKQKFLRLGIKNSKGCQKRIKIGTDEYVSKNFTIYLFGNCCNVIFCTENDSRLEHPDGAAENSKRCCF